MNHAEHFLVAFCDEVLAAIGELRRVAEAAGKPFPTPRAVNLINRVLDLRLKISREVASTPGNTEETNPKTN